MQDLLAQLCACARDAGLLSLERRNKGVENCAGGGGVMCTIKLLEK